MVGREERGGVHIQCLETYHDGPLALRQSKSDMTSVNQKHIAYFFVLFAVQPCTILQINPTRCTILSSIFISFLYMFRATMCPSSGEITVSMRHWYLSLCMGGVWSAGWISIQPADQTPPIQSDKYQCRIDTVISPDDGHIIARNMGRKEINILDRIVQLVRFICKIISLILLRKLVIKPEWLLVTTLERMECVWLL